MKRSTSSQSTFTLRIFRWPLLIGIGSAVGLLSALLGDGFLDALSWTLLAIPVLVSAACYWCRPLR